MFPSGRLWPERGIKIGLMTGVSLLTVRSREHIEYEVVVGRMLIERSIGWLVVVLNWSLKLLNEYSRRSLVRTVVATFGRLGRQADEKASLCSAHFDAKQCRYIFQ